MSGFGSGRLVIRVDTDLCAGHGLCASQAEDLFILDGDGFCIADGTVIPTGREGEAREGVRACPELALRLEED